MSDQPIHNACNLNSSVGVLYIHTYERSMIFISSQLCNEAPKV